MRATPGAKGKADSVAAAGRKVPYFFLPGSDVA